MFLKVVPVRRLVTGILPIIVRSVSRHLLTIDEFALPPTQLSTNLYLRLAVKFSMYVQVSIGEDFAVT